MTYLLIIILGALPSAVVATLNVLDARRTRRVKPLHKLDERQDWEGE